MASELSPKRRTWLLAAILSAIGCSEGGTPVPFGEACTKVNDDKVVAIEGILDEGSSLSCEVGQYDHAHGHCRFSMRSFDGTSGSVFTLEVDKGSGKNEVSLGGQDGVGLRRYDPGKVVFTDRGGRSFRFGDRIRVVAKIHVDPVINPSFPPSCSLDLKSLELIAAGTPADQKAREAARGSIKMPKQDKACAKGDELTIGGVNEDIHVTGECASVSVSGGDNRVTIDSAGRIAVSGIKNSVRWRQGLDGKPPKISNSGIDNTVERLP